VSNKLRVALLFGGRSAEHDVSVLSAANIFRALDPERYETVAIAITRAGKWLLCPLTDNVFPTAVPEQGPQASLLPGGGGRLLVMSEDDPNRVDASLTVDVLFPALHGPYGEDGTVQGLAELADVPYVGSDVLGSASAMDKDVAKRLMMQMGLPTARFVSFRQGEPVSFETVSRELGRPVFVKPARLGSSIGVSKASSKEELELAVAEAFRHDVKILVEECVFGREIECGVLENDDGSVLVSAPGEIVPSNRHDFYTYEAKYLDEDGALIKVPASVPDDVIAPACRLAGDVFKALGCQGMARVDFFLREDGSLLINEVNTLPGFTNISMYPKVLAASGVSYAELADRLIRHALARKKHSSKPTTG
jgi:D-alanine-D-alanine ligase